MSSDKIQASFIPLWNGTAFHSAPMTRTEYAAIEKAFFENNKKIKIMLMCGEVLVLPKDACHNFSIMYSSADLPKSEPKLPRWKFWRK